MRVSGYTLYRLTQQPPHAARPVTVFTAVANLSLAAAHAPEGIHQQALRRLVAKCIFTSGTSWGEWTCEEAQL